jgi:exopolysaccharide biosynthesis polyprenyl glycosylphosphotransferase
MSFWRLRVVVTVNQVLAVIASAFIAFNVAPRVMGETLRLFETTDGILFGQGSLVLLWTVQLHLLWNPSEFTSNKNLFRPASIGKSSVIMLIAVGILAGYEESLHLFTCGLLFVALGSMLLLVLYLNQRRAVKKLGISRYFKKRPTLLGNSSELKGRRIVLKGRASLDHHSITDSSLSTLAGALEVRGQEDLERGGLLDALREEGVEAVLVTEGFLGQRGAKDLVAAAQRRGIDSLLLTPLGPEAADKLDVILFDTETAVFVKSQRGKQFRSLAKRGIDVLLSAVGLVALAPVMMLIALAVKADSPGPAIFKSERIGRAGKPFMMYKFRSMIDGAHDSHFEMYQRRPELAHGGMLKLLNDPRITRVGSFIRRTSLDELPQLWNVLRGTMSLVGPRPLHEVEIAKIKGIAIDRLAVLPGLTGLWQVNGRSLLTWEESIELDLLYVSNQSIWLDLTIIARTIPVLFSGKGAF